MTLLSAIYSNNVLLYRSIIGVSLIMLASIFSNARASESSAGSLILHHKQSSLAAIQLDASLTVNIRGLVAEIELVQRFKNTTHHWVEGRYLFPLSEDSLIRALTITIGDRIIEGEIKTREEAKQTYKTASDNGQIASLVNLQRPNLFSINVSNIAALEDITIRLSLVMPVTINKRQMELNLPTTLTPRYTNKNTPDKPTISTPFASLTQVRGPRISASIHFNDNQASSELSSQTHRLNKVAGHYEINDVPMNKDIRLSWPLATENQGTSMAFVTQHKGDNYLQIVFQPPFERSSIVQEPRELILVVDKSGSMAGVSMEAAKNALHYAVNQLNPTDTFNIVAFDERFQPLFDSAQSVSEETVRLAHRFTRSLDANGGTEMAEVLDFAFDINSTGLPRLRQVVFITDGSVSYEDYLLKKIRTKIGTSRLFTIGIGPAPNQWFLEKAAEVGKGTSLFIADSQNVHQPLTDLLEKLKAPVLTDVSVQFIGGHGELYPDPIPDIYADSPAVWFAKVSSSVKSVEVTGNYQQDYWSQSVSITDSVADQASNHNTSASAIAMLWTKSKIDSLTDEQRFAQDTDLHKQLITDLALNAGLVTQYTSFVAVEQQQVRPSSEPLLPKQVTNLLPSGNQMTILALPQGATGVSLVLMKGIGFFIVSCLLFMLANYQSERLGKRRATKRV